MTALNVLLVMFMIGFLIGFFEGLIIAWRPEVFFGGALVALGLYIWSVPRVSSGSEQTFTAVVATASPETGVLLAVFLGSLIGSWIGMFAYEMEFA